MNSTFSLLLLLATTSACASATPALSKPSDLLGTWRCGPVVMQGSGFTVTYSEQITWEGGGTYVSYGATVMATPNKVPVTLTDRSNGTWKLEDGIIETHVLRSQFLSASDPAVTREAGQKAHDDQIKKKSVYQNRILEHTADRYRTFPVNAMYKEAEVELSCDRSKPISAAQ